MDDPATRYGGISPRCWSELAGLPSRSSRSDRDEARLRALRFGEAFACDRDRRLASPMPDSWNQIANWLKQIDKLRLAA